MEDFVESEDGVFVSVFDFIVFNFVDNLYGYLEGKDVFWEIIKFMYIDWVDWDNGEMCCKILLVFFIDY